MTLSKRWKIALGILGGVVVAASLAFVFGARWASRNARELVMKSLREQFHGDVQLDSIEMKMFPTVQIAGAGVAIYLPGRDDLPPVISIKSFTAQAGWLGLLRMPRHISRLTLVGLQITIPTGQPDDADESAAGANSSGGFHGAIMDDMHVENATLTIMPKVAGKQPQVFDIESMQAHSISGDGKMASHTTLRSSIPPGEIHSSGTFGPWNADIPALTPVTGDFSFPNADLSTIKGISGTLSAEGHYAGVLEKIAADGSTDAPNFSTDSGGHAMDLATTFHVIVDGANGETTLQPLSAHFGQTTLHATGTIAGTPGQQGNAVSMDVNATDARIEDILLLAVKDEPAMTGDVRLNTTLVLPAGAQTDVQNEMILRGTFSVDKVVFTDHAVEKKVNTLSMRSQGNTGDVPDDNAASEMQGTFQIQNGVMTFSELKFNVPGAQVRMTGTFGLEHQDFDMRGTLDMDASLSQTTTGVKSFLLRAVNPLFAKPGGGTRIFFRLGGTEKVPIYTLDIRHKTLEKTQNQNSGKNNTADARSN